MTTHCWGELAMGTWTLEVHNEATQSHLVSWSLVLHGTATHPQSGRHSVSPPVAPPPSLSLPSDIGIGGGIHSGAAGIRPASSALGCKEEEYYLNNACFGSCPSGFYGFSAIFASTVNANRSNNGSATITTLPPITGQFNVQNGTENTTSDHLNQQTSKNFSEREVKMCIQCHTSCQSCFANDFFHCSSCFDGFSLSKDNVCHKTLVFNLVPERMFSTLVIALVFCVSAFVLFCLIFVILQLRSSTVEGSKCCPISEVYHSVQDSELCTNSKPLLLSESDDDDCDTLENGKGSFRF